MNVQEYLKEIGERLQSSATVKKVYGDPVEVEGKTIIPVARVRYGFGGGGGTQEVERSSEGADAPGQATGGGGGGGVEVSPVGSIEVTGEETRYVSFEDRGGL